MPESNDHCQPSYSHGALASVTDGRFWAAKCFLMVIVAALLLSCTPAIIAYPAVGLPPAYQLKSERPFSDTSLLTVPEHPGERSHGAKLTPRIVSSLALFVAAQLTLHPYLPATMGGLAFLLSGILVAHKITQDRTVALLTGLMFAGLYATNACFSLNFMPKPFDGIAIGFVALTAMMIDRPALLAVSAYLGCWTDERVIVSLGLISVLVMLMPQFDRRAKLIRCAILGGSVAVYFVSRSGLSMLMGWNAADLSMVGNPGGTIPLTQMAAWSCFEGGWAVIGLAFWVTFRSGKIAEFALLAGASVAVIASCLIVLDISRAGSFAFPLIFVSIAVLASQREKGDGLPLVTAAAAIVSLLAMNFEIIAGSVVEPAIIEPLPSSSVTLFYALVNP